MTLESLQYLYRPSNMGELLARTMGPDSFEQACISRLDQQHQGNWMLGSSRSSITFEYQAVHAIAERERSYLHQLCEFDPCS